MSKHTIEDIVINSITSLLFSEEKLQEMADLIVEKQAKSCTEILLQREFREAEIGLPNLPQQRYKQSEKRRSEPEISKRIEQICEKISRDEVLCWLKRFRRIDTSDIRIRKMIVNIFVNAVYVFDDHIVIAHNFKEKARTTEVEEITCRLDSGSDRDCFCLPNRRIITPIMRRFS